MNRAQTLTRCGTDMDSGAFVPAEHVHCCWLPNDRDNLARLVADPNADPAVVRGLRRTIARMESR